MLSAICVSSLDNVHSTPLPSLKGLLCFGCRNLALSILYTNPLSDIWFENIFPMLWVPFTPLIGFGEPLTLSVDASAHVPQEGPCLLSPCLPDHK